MGFQEQLRIRWRASWRRAALALSTPRSGGPRGSKHMMSQPKMVLDLQLEAEVSRTPCGQGDLVWRKWGSGAPVVLCHGGSGSWTHWIRTIPTLRHHYEVWVPDLPGLGDSTM